MDSNLIDNRHIRIFISSTFRDMQDERDYLMKRTFPKLRKLAAERDVTLTELDLRWGITEEESQSGKVVEICLREIENSIPFFIGIIGNRYGWVPKREELGDSLTEHFDEVNNYIKRHLSVTEMEMQFGVLEREEQMHAYFYIKEEEEHADNSEMLQHLKEEIRKSQYPSSTYHSLEDLASQIEGAFTILLDKLFPDSHLTEMEKERIGQRSFMNQLCRNYIKNERNFKVLDDWLASNVDSHFIVTGVSGLGKSALLANWIKETLNRQDCKYNILYHFTGNGGSESSHEHITRTLINEIKELYGWKKDDSSSELKNLFYRVSAEGGKPLLIVIDAINQIIDTDNAKLLNWLPIPTKNIKILFSTLEEDRTMEVFKNRNYPIYTLRPLDIEQRSHLVKKYLRMYGKSLSDRQLMRIVTDSKCENTLVLKTLLDELIKFGIYEKLDDRIEYYLASNTIDSFYQTFLTSYEEDYGREHVAMVLSLIAVSKHGLSEQEILAITGCTPLAWSQIYCAFDSQFTSKKGLLFFSHTYVSEAIKHRYLKDKEKSHIYRKKIIGVFKNQDSIRVWEELLHQYYEVGDLNSLSTILQKVRILHLMIKNHAEEVALYMRALIDEGFDLSVYQGLIMKEEDINRKYGLFISFFVDYFSAFELGLALCKDYKQALKNSNINLPSDESLEKLYIWIGRIYRNKSRYPEALTAFSKAYTVCRQLYGNEHQYTAGILELSLNEKCVTYIQSREWKKALTHGKKALDIALKIYGKNHQSTATCLNNIGVIYEEQGKYKKALAFQLKALEIRKATLGPNHQDTASSFNNISRIYDESLDLISALEYGKKALDIRIKIFGKEHPETANSFNNIALIYGKRGDKEKELKYLERALRIYLKVYGESGSKTITAYANIGVIYGEMGNSQMALEYGKKALDFRLKLFGEVNTDTVKSFMNVGEAYRELGLNQEALACEQKALEILLKIYGEEHSTTATCLTNIALIYGAIEEYNKELECYQKALGIRRRILGEQNLETAYSYMCIGDAYSDLEDYQKALKYYHKSLEIQNKISGDNNLKILETYEHILLLFSRIGDFTKAIECTDKIISIIKMVDGDQSLNLAQYYEYMGIFYQAKNEYPDALYYIGKAYEISKEVGNTESEAIYLNSLGRIYALMGDKETAITKFEKAIDLLPERHPEAIDSKQRIEVLKA